MLVIPMTFSVLRSRCLQTAAKISLMSSAKKKSGMYMKRSIEELGTMIKKTHKKIQSEKHGDKSKLL